MFTAGIDIGTTSICVVVRDAASGETARTVSCRNDASLASPHRWEYIQDPDRIVGRVLELVAQCGSEWSAAAGIGISCQMHGMMYVDSSGLQASPLYTWQDGRGAQEIVPGLTYVEELERLTGYHVPAGYGLATHYYNVKNGLVPAEANRLCTIGDYVAMRLAGSAEPLMDVTNAASIGLFDLKAGAFDEAALRRAGIGSSLLPELARGDRPAGMTADGKPIVSAIGDNQASFLGAVPDLGKTLLVNIGTGAQISVYSAGLAEVDGLETRPFPDGGCLLVGATLGGGKVYELLKRFFKSAVGLLGETEVEDGVLFARMNRLALEELERDAAYPQVATQLYGTRREPKARGSVTGLDANNLLPGPIIAGFLAGIAGELAGFASLLPPSLTEQLETIAGSGNGIRQNPAMQRLLQTAFRLPLTLSASLEEAAAGAAIHATVGCGLHPDYASALRAGSPDA